MAFDLVVFNTQVHTVATETVSEQVRLFNEASAGAITLVPGAENSGDISMQGHSWGSKVGIWSMILRMVAARPFEAM